LFTNGDSFYSAEKFFISKTIDQFFTGIYDVSKFCLLFFKEAVTPPYEFQETIK
jgi:hypothetical protein